MVKTLALAVAMQTAGAIAEPGAQVNSAFLGEVDYGIICPAGDIKRLPAEGTTLGYISERQAPQEIALTTQIVPLIKGIGFGVRSKNISGDVMGSVKVTVTHPYFPEHGSTHDVWFDTFEYGSVNFNFFTFEFPFEMQTGQWTFTASRLDVPLYSVSFQVVDPKTVPHLADICDGPALTS